METVKTGIVGLGARGYSVLRDNLMQMEDVSITAVCDVLPERVERAQKLFTDKGLPVPKGYTDFHSMLRDSGIEALLVTTGWEWHNRIALEAMEDGIPVATEVGCEYSMEMIERLVETQEKTGTEFMFLENCCYDKTELLATSMVRKGLFGTIVECEGSYSHDLRNEIAYGIENHHYRFRNYEHRNTNNYPTHCLGPIARLLNINRGNRILTVQAAASKSEGLPEYIREEAAKHEIPDYMKQTRFLQSDIVLVNLTCANGELISLKLDTSLPRFYARNFTVRGTKGLYEQNTNTVYLDGSIPEMYDSLEAYRRLFNNGVQYEEKYLPRIWKEVTPEVLKAGHGGMDYFVYHDFIDSVKHHTLPTIDVYDAATWLAVSVLAERSLTLGGEPQFMPDYTSGQWFHREPKDVVDLS